MLIKKILLVDDDAEDSEFFTTVVQQMSPEIKVTVANGNEELFQNLQQEKPEIIFIDSFLQNESGHRSIQEIRTTPGFAQLPVIMYTGASDGKSISSAFEMGASSYIVKPHSLAEIKKVLQIILHKDWDVISSPRKQYYMNQQFYNFDESV
jgi:DNA-binding response OmpR family regulator